MSIEKLTIFNIQTDQRYHKIWLAAMNPKEFQRVVRFEHCEAISIPSICDEITLNLNEEATGMIAIESCAKKPIRSFWIASQLFIGLAHVHEQQVKFLYDLASRYIIPTKLLIESFKNDRTTEPDDASTDTPIRPHPRQALKRKISTNVQGSLKRKISLSLDTSSEPDDIETQNMTTMELLRNAFVSNNADISIPELIDVPKTNELDESTYSYDMQFSEEKVPEHSAFDNELLEDDFMSMTLNQEQMADDVGVPVNMWESTRRPSSIGFDSTIYGAPKDVTENTENVADDESAELDLGTTTAIEIDIPEVTNDATTLIEPIETDMPDLTDSAPGVNNVPSSRKRRRTRSKHPLKDVTLNINVQQNVKTVSTTQRHLTAKDDSVLPTTCLSKLSHNIFNEPSHSTFTESMARQFEPRPMSGKLLQSFKRMALTKAEETNRDLVQEFCCSDVAVGPDDSQPVHVTSMPAVESSLFDVPHLQEMELSQPLMEVSGDGSISLPSTSIDEQTSASAFLETSSICQRDPVELSPAIRQILAINEPEAPITRCDTASQELFASRSRQNRLAWGKEGVLQKLMSLWDSGVYPIGMKELMQSNNQRMSAATAFFSVMELQSTRIGLIDITKAPDSNGIFNIAKSPKLVELHQQMV